MKSKEKTSSSFGDVKIFDYTCRDYGKLKSSKPDMSTRQRAPGIEQASENDLREHGQQLQFASLLPVDVGQRLPPKRSRFDPVRLQSCAPETSSRFFR
jgi:hypothetical protein